MSTITELKSKLNEKHCGEISSAVYNFKLRYTGAVNDSTGKSYTDLAPEILKEELDITAVEAILKAIVELEKDLKQTLNDSLTYLKDDAEVLSKFSSILDQISNLFEIHTLMYSQLKE